MSEECGVVVGSIGKKIWLPKIRIKCFIKYDHHEHAKKRHLEHGIDHRLVQPLTWGCFEIHGSIDYFRNETPDPVSVDREANNQLSGSHSAAREIGRPTNAIDLFDFSVQAISMHGWINYCPKNVGLLWAALATKIWLPKIRIKCFNK